MRIIKCMFYPIKFENVSYPQIPCGNNNTASISENVIAGVYNFGEIAINAVLETRSHFVHFIKDSVCNYTEYFFSKRDCKIFPSRYHDDCKGFIGGYNNDTGNPIYTIFPDYSEEDLEYNTDASVVEALQNYCNSTVLPIMNGTTPAEYPSISGNDENPISWYDWKVILPTVLGVSLTVVRVMRCLHNLRNTKDLLKYLESVAEEELHNYVKYHIGTLEKYSKTPEQEEIFSMIVNDSKLAKNYIIGLHKSDSKIKKDIQSFFSHIPTGNEESTDVGISGEDSASSSV